MVIVAGSSRVWAAKGVALLGSRAVLATSFERIHRSNLVGTGALPVLLVGLGTPARAHGDHRVTDEGGVAIGYG